MHVGLEVPVDVGTDDAFLGGHLIIPADELRVIVGLSEIVDHVGLKGFDLVELWTFNLEEQLLTLLRLD